MSAHLWSTTLSAPEATLLLDYSPSASSLERKPPKTSSCMRCTAGLNVLKPAGVRPVSSLQLEVLMKICIYGAGAIGGFLGVELMRAGADISLVARGAHLAAMRQNGLKLLIGDEERVVHPRCTDNPAELGRQDFVIICLKAHSITAVIDRMKPLLGPQTRIVTAVNGIPYWYFYKHGGR